jgi:hypothetical protein
MWHPLRWRLVGAVLSLAVLASCASAGQENLRRGGAARRGGRRCRAGCGGGVPPPPPPPPPSSDCSACPTGYYTSSQCTTTSNRVCALCSTRAASCPSGQFLSGCGSTSAGACTQCAACSAGHYRTGCSGTSAGQWITRRLPTSCARHCAVTCVRRLLPDFYGTTPRTPPTAFRIVLRLSRLPRRTVRRGLRKHIAGLLHSVHLEL